MLETVASGEVVLYRVAGEAAGGKNQICTLSAWQVVLDLILNRCTAMSDGSAIEWTDATWNPIRGCTKVSPGCKHCYAETFAERFRGVPDHLLSDNWISPPTTITSPHFEA